MKASSRDSVMCPVADLCGSPSSWRTAGAGQLGQSQGRRQSVVDRGEKLLVEGCTRGRDVVVELLRAARAHDGGGHTRLAQDPCERELRHAETGSLGQRDQRDVWGDN